MKPCPFTILIDTAESLPWTFHGMSSDSRGQWEHFDVTTGYRCLGRHPNSLGDYSIEGFVGQVAIERKSIEDCQGTLLSWPQLDKHGNEIKGRRDRFKQELLNLEKIQCAAVIVEGSMWDVVSSVPDYGAKTRRTQAKILQRSIIAMQQDFRVPWFFCSGRRHAENVAFRFLERFWRHNS